MSDLSPSLKPADPLNEEVTYGIVIGTWLAFLSLITIKEILLRLRDTSRFIEQYVQNTQTARLDTDVG